MKGILIRTFNKFETLYEEVANGLSSLGTSLVSQKKKYLDKVKLAVLMWDLLNSILKKWKYLNDEQRKKIIIYGWILVSSDVHRTYPIYISDMGHFETCPNVPCPKMS